MKLWPSAGQRSSRKSPAPSAEPHVPSAAGGDHASRVRRASSDKSPPSTLQELARDPDIVVRAAVAINAACSAEINTILAADADERVRALLGARIAQLLPALDSEARDGAARHVYALLDALARDHAIRVRAAIAEAVKSMPEAPHDLVLLLAKDEAFTVSDPVLRLSPVLTDADLLTLLATPPHAGAATSIASRSGLSAAVAHAIAEHADAPAIRTLLANPSASIKEATLDALIGRAPYHSDWHGPLVHRPHLSASAVRALSQLVADDLLDVLRARKDVGAAVLETARQHATTLPQAFRHSAERDESLVRTCERLKAEGGLNEAVFTMALRTGDLRRAAACLAVASGVGLGVVDQIAAVRNGRALVSLVARAGFSMSSSVAAQMALTQLTASELLRPEPDGTFPLSEDEMQWQLELLVQPALAAQAAEMSCRSALATQAY